MHTKKLSRGRGNLLGGRISQGASPLPSLYVCITTRDSMMHTLKPVLYSSAPPLPLPCQGYMQKVFVVEGRRLFPPSNSIILTWSS